MVQEERGAIGKVSRKQIGLDEKQTKKRCCRQYPMSIGEKRAVPMAKYRGGYTACPVQGCIGMSGAAGTHRMKRPCEWLCGGCHDHGTRSRSLFAIDPGRDQTGHPAQVRFQANTLMQLS